MSKITVITAADANFKEMVDIAHRSAKDVGYKTIVYDLGGLGYGKPFNGRVSDAIGAKIPSKPSMILDALNGVEYNDIVVWMDADAIMWNRIDEITDEIWDFGVTVRKPKSSERDDLINAGVVFVRKTESSLKFMDLWIKNCSTGVSDQKELNQLFQFKNADYLKKKKTQGMVVKCFSCDLYNNFYFKRPQTDAKITHYKSKLRYMWPRRTISKIPKMASMEQKLLSSEPRF
jgi:hypothetical protein